MGALFACSDSGPTLASDGGEITLRTVNGATLSGQPAVEDSVVLTAEIRLGPDAPAVESAALLADGTVAAVKEVRVAPGATAGVTLLTYEIPSGTRRVQVLARAADGSTVATSGAASITVSRPRSHVRILRINGAPPPQGGASAAVADSFLLDLLVVAGDNEAPPERIQLHRDGANFPRHVLGTSQVTMERGRTYRIPYAAWITVPGRYGVSLKVHRFQRNEAGTVIAAEAVASLDPITVDVTNSDVTPPVIRSPADGLVLTFGQKIPFEATDDRGIWEYGIPHMCHMVWALDASPTLTGTVTDELNPCVSVGENRVVVRAVDTAGNVTTDEVTIHVVRPAAGAAASPAAQPGRTVIRQIPDRAIEQVIAPSTGN